MSIMDSIEARHTQCWRVGALVHLSSDDPCFSTPMEAHQHASERSEAHSSTAYGIWFYEQGTEGSTLPDLEWVYFEGESFIKE